MRQHDFNVFTRARKRTDDLTVMALVRIINELVSCLYKGKIGEYSCYCYDGMRMKGHTITCATINDMYAKEESQ